jgi:hypothetical protein
MSAEQELSGTQLSLDFPPVVFTSCPFSMPSHCPFSECTAAIHGLRYIADSVVGVAALYLNPECIPESYR